VRGLFADSTSAGARRLELSLCVKIDILTKVFTKLFAESSALLMA